VKLRLDVFGALEDEGTRAGKRRKSCLSSLFLVVALRTPKPWWDVLEVHVTDLAPYRKTSAPPILRQAAMFHSILSNVLCFCLQYHLSFVKKVSKNTLGTKMSLKKPRNE
jgi:hypothetical protein